RLLLFRGSRTCSRTQVSGPHHLATIFLPDGVSGKGAVACTRQGGPSAQQYDRAGWPRHRSRAVAARLPPPAVIAMPAEGRPPVHSTAREWALAAGAQPDADITAAEIEPVLVDILEQLLELTVSDPFPIRAARRLGARLCAEPLHQVRMLAL